MQQTAYEMYAASISILLLLCERSAYQHCSWEDTDGSLQTVNHSQPKTKKNTIISFKSLSKQFRQGGNGIYLSKMVVAFNDYQFWQVKLGCYGRICLCTVCQQVAACNERMCKLAAVFSGNILLYCFICDCNIYLFVSVLSCYVWCMSESYVLQNRNLQKSSF